MSIKLVQGDTLPQIILTITDTTTGEPINLGDSSTSVNLHIRKAVGGARVMTIPCGKVEDEPGKVSFAFSNSSNLVGQYEGEIEIDFDGNTLTVFETLKFTFREQI